MFDRKALLALIVITVMGIFSLAGCSTSTTTFTMASNDFQICENLLLAWYQALNANNFALALSYCKPGGIMFDYTNDLWRLSTEYPFAYVFYTVTDIYGHEYINVNMISMYHDFCKDFYYNGWYFKTDCEIRFLVLFEKVYGEWKLA